MNPQKPLPVATPETQEYWAGLRRGELRVQRCRTCNRHYFYPRPFCPHPGCHSRDVEWTTVSGRGKLHSYVIAHRAHPAFAAPYVIAIVALDEGPKMMTNLLIDDPRPETLPSGAPVQIVYETVNEADTLPKFRLV